MLLSSQHLGRPHHYGGVFIMVTAADTAARRSCWWSGQQMSALMHVWIFARTHFILVCHRQPPTVCLLEKIAAAASSTLLTLSLSPVKETVRMFAVACVQLDYIFATRFGQNTWFFLVWTPCGQMYSNVLPISNGNKHFLIFRLSFQAAMPSLLYLAISCYLSLVAN